MIWMQISCSWTRLCLRSCHDLRHRFILRKCNTGAMLTFSMPVTCEVSVCVGIDIWAPARGVHAFSERVSLSHSCNRQLMRVPCLARIALVHPRITLDRDVTLRVFPPSMSSQASVNALSKFYPPGTNLTPVGLLDAVNNISSVTESFGSPFPAAGVLIHRGLVWYAKGDPGEDGDVVPRGRWKCLACENTKTAFKGDPPGDDPWGFGKATVH